MTPANPQWNPKRASSNEWYSPAWIVEPARALMGAFDLDPASCREANRIIQAERYYTKDDDGLSKQ